MSSLPPPDRVLASLFIHGLAQSITASASLTIGGVNGALAIGGNDFGGGRYRASRRRGWGALLAVSGLVASTAAVLGLSRMGPPATEPSSGDHTATVLDASTVRVNRPADLTLATVTYGPGQSSGWHSHPGMHLVEVVAGTLTVYGPDCQPTTYGPGQPYIGGQGVHLARNETDTPVEMAVTYLRRPGQSMVDFRISQPAPPGCAGS